ncbi:bifunctional Homeobox-like domain superfamily/SANT-Myb domain/Myb domain/J-protein Zuotin-DnaJC2 [Babesia duncani]|uniref:Bifunctional Homeobox-like domain superfamily/SANT-Myb domain/Myb domain/J-protein Zuotin-DnaJC2 n=1 Tax=Babesia duncani TaxID=323732 RepID=A0AAD9PPA1_9APIC|nr:bifunctional Homeobox-like domain superfamily/SANT-Myb domain/Myb domain/J-protein Zuotin-DnaJC2 [Babesia duncani]
MDPIIKAAQLENVSDYEAIVVLLVDTLKPHAATASLPTCATSVKQTENKVENNENENEDPTWSASELAALSRATDTYSAGVASRWNLIAKFVKTKSMSQCIQMAKNMASGLVPKPEEPQAGQSVWTEAQQNAFEAALKRYPPSLEPGVRWKNVASSVPDKSPRECIQRFKLIKAAIMGAGKR